jgi:predicted ester cyclase
MDFSQQAKSLLQPLRLAMYNFEAAGVQQAMQSVFAADAKICLAYPFGILHGADSLYEQVYAPLFKSIPDLERRDYIVISGVTEQDDLWVGCAGFYMGTFAHNWLDIPATGHVVHMRFHEFYCIKDNRIVEMQALWDIPEVMFQAGAWPLAPALGKTWHVPGPATQNGLSVDPYNDTLSAQSRDQVVAMLTAMIRHPAQGGPEVMELDKFWHPRFNWYGPTGIGTARGVSGFRNWHQIPFLRAMPDRGLHNDDVNFHFFADGEYVGVTGWPNMKQTISHDGWMGIAPTNKIVTLKSLDFWRLENNLIRENWVLVDLLDLYQQIDVDVFSRLREFNRARAGFNPDTGHSDS